jgi:hypothetical protein
MPATAFVAHLTRGGFGQLMSPVSKHSSTAAGGEVVHGFT